MKSITILPFIAIAISPALSQPRTAAIDNITNSAPLHSRNEPLPYGCNPASEYVTNQVAEISQLQARNIPIPPNLAGYIFAVVYGHRLAGCPPITLLGPNGNSTSVADKRSSETTAIKDPCGTVRILREQVMDQMSVLRGYNIPVPPYLAGWWSLTEDAYKILAKYGLPCEENE